MKQIEFKVSSKSGRAFLGDATFLEKNVSMPIVIFCHGFKGFKDWGAWNEIAKEFANEGFCFIKFNFSHNGIGLENKQEFLHLNEFANNTISKEILDLESLLDYLPKIEELKNAVNLNNINIIGHSRGAATAFIAASKMKKFNKIAGWAGVYALENWIEKYNLEEWETNGSIGFPNKRTNQEMTVNYELAKEIIQGDYVPSKYLINLEIPILLLHGEKDEAVSHMESETVYNNILHSIYILINGANHTFGTKHPFTGELPKDMIEVVENTVEFFKD